MTITIYIGKTRILDEAEKTSAYLGSKRSSVQDPEAYRRVSLVTANREQLDRYWMETCSAATSALRRWLVSVSDHTAPDSQGYTITLEPSVSWPAALKSSVKESLTGYFVNSLLSKWLMIVLPEFAEVYANLAASMLQDAVSKMYQREKPKRRN